MSVSFFLLFFFSFFQECTFTICSTCTISLQCSPFIAVLLFGEISLTSFSLKFLFSRFRECFLLRIVLQFCARYVSAIFLTQSKKMHDYSLIGVQARQVNRALRSAAVKFRS